MEERFLDINKSYNSLSQIPIFTFHGLKEGPVVWITAGSQVEDMASVEVIHRLIPIFKRIVIKAGNIHVMPMMNPMSPEQMSGMSPLDSEKLRLVYPGDAHGSTAQRTAARIYHEIVRTKPALVINLQGASLRSMPYISLGHFITENPCPKKSAKLFELANVFGMTGVYEYCPMDYRAKQLDKSLTGALLNHAQNILAYTVELGPKSGEENFVVAGLQGILNNLIYLGLMDGAINPVSNPLKIEGRWRQEAKIRANKSGYASFAVQPGDYVCEGQALVRVKNLAGEVQEVICAKTSGFVMAIEDRRVVQPGTELLSLAVEYN